MPKAPNEALLPADAGTAARHGPRLGLWLAPLRGVTIRAFRETFAGAVAEAGFDGAFAPFVPANPGFRAGDRLLKDLSPVPFPMELVPQVITRHPDAMRIALLEFKALGYGRADLNAGCPFPMIVRKGRGAGLLRNPDLLERLVAAGCETSGAGRFSVKTRLGLENPRELLSLIPMLNRYPLAALTVHARTARQMYGGECDMDAFAEICAASSNPVLYNGDAAVGDVSAAGAAERFRGAAGVMVGRAFVRSLGCRADSVRLLSDYISRSRLELCGDRPVLGRVKELLSYWKDGSPRWRRFWPAAKMCRTAGELESLMRAAGAEPACAPPEDCGKIRATKFRYSKEQENGSLQRR